MLVGFFPKILRELSRTNTSWTIGLVFGTAKLKPRQQYQLVLNGVMGDADAGYLGISFQRQLGVFDKDMISQKSLAGHCLQISKLPKVLLRDPNLSVALFVVLLVNLPRQEVVRLLETW